MRTLLTRIQGMPRRARSAGRERGQADRLSHHVYRLALGSTLRQRYQLATVQ